MNTAGWSLSSDVPNSWTEYTFVDQIKKPTYGEHYGIALELDTLPTYSPHRRTAH